MGSRSPRRMADEYERDLHARLVRPRPVPGDPQGLRLTALVAALGGVAAASEQGDGRAVVEIAGPAARDVLV